MLETITFTNKKNQSVVIGDGSTSQFVIEDISGVSAPDAIINTSSTAGKDGSDFLNSAVGNRNIVLTIRIMGDASDGKRKLYQAFPIKREGTFRYKSDLYDVKIKGRVEKLEILPMAYPLVAVISLICTQPYFEAIDEVTAEITSITNGFYFPLVLPEEGIALGVINQHYAANIYNEGDVPLGLKVEFRASGAVTNPKIINTQTLEFIEIEADLIAGDVVTVTTQDGNKRVTLVRNGEEYNYFNYLADGSTFLELEEGDNEFQYTAAEGESNLYLRLSYTPLYVGV